MLRDELIPALEYATWSLGWRFAPRLLSAVERVGHRVRDRALSVRVHRLSVAGRELHARVVSWDAPFARALERKLGSMQVVDDGTVRASRLSPALADDVDLAFVELPEHRAAPFLAHGFFLMPKRVAHVEALDRPDSALVRRLSSTLQARGVTFDVTRDPRALAAFVRDVYRPFAFERHGERARPTPASVLHLVHARGWLLRVHEAGRLLGGALLARSLLDRERLEIVVIGVAPDRDDEATRSAPVILARSFARELGFRRCDHLGSLPFLDDGIFRRKRRYGTVPEDMGHRIDRVAVFAREASHPWLATSPFLVLSRGTLVDVRSLVSTLRPKEESC